ncbi:MAG: 50S ribosomal protein L28 [Actinomycetota bacterium]|nr:50S ribosomal protein L28 [Actinomycetota bacterium]
MAKRCEICGKSPSYGKNVSHSHRKTPRRWNVNIQKVQVIINGSPKNINVCTRCLKSNKITRAL